MKKLFISLFLLLSIFGSSGCTTAIGKLDGALNGVSASEVTYVRKGKFTSATIKAENYNNSDEKTSADVIYIDEEIFGVGSINVSLKNYQRLKNKSENTETPQSIK
jgi:hypothetical protein